MTDRKIHIHCYSARAVPVIDVRAYPVAVRKLFREHSHYSEATDVDVIDLTDLTKEARFMLEFFRAVSGELRSIEGIGRSKAYQLVTQAKVQLSSDLYETADGSQRIYWELGGLGTLLANYLRMRWSILYEPEKLLAFYSPASNYKRYIGHQKDFREVKAFTRRDIQNLRLWVLSFDLSRTH